MTSVRPPFLAIAVLVMVAAGLVGCGSSAKPPAGSTAGPSAGASTASPPRAAASGVAAGSAAGAAGAPNPCSLITDAKAGTLLGGPAAHKDGGSRDASNGSGVVVTENLCEWSLITSDQLGHDLWVAVYAGADRAYFDDAVTHETAIPGLGDAATGDSIHVWVISRGTVLQVYGSLPASTGLQEAASIAIGKL